MSNVLFEQRVGIWVFGKKIWDNPYVKKTVWWNVYERESYVCWPLAKIQFFKNFLIVKILWKEIKIPYKTIKEVSKTGFWIKIDRKNLGPILVSSLFPNSFYKKIKEVVKKHKLQMKIL